MGLKMPARKTPRYHAKTHEAAVDAMRRTGTYLGVCEALNLPRTTLQYWRRDHPELDTELSEAREGFDTDRGAQAKTAIQIYFDGYLATGGRDAPPPPDAAMVRFALNRLDGASWTQPNTEATATAEGDADALLDAAQDVND